MEYADEQIQEILNIDPALDELLRADFSAYSNILNIFKKVVSSYDPSGFTGAIDVYELGEIKGWIKKTDSNESQFITLGINDRILFECFLADHLRQDLANLHIGNGAYGFRVNVLPAETGKMPFITWLSDPFTGKICRYKIMC